MKGGSRDVTKYTTLERKDGRLFVTHKNLDYAIVPKTRNQELHARAINVVFLDFIDESPERTTRKRWTLPFVIRITKPLNVGDDPMAADFEITDLMQDVLDCLKDQAVEIYDFKTMAKLGRGTWVKTAGYRPADESLPVEGGSIRQALTVNVTFVDKTR